MQSSKPLFGRKIKKPTSGERTINLLSPAGVRLPVYTYIQGEYLSQSGNVDALTATGINTGTPEFTLTVLGQRYTFVATGIIASPTVDNASVNQNQSFTITGIQTTPTLSIPVLTQNTYDYSLTATGIQTTPTVDTGALNQVHALGSIGIDTGAPTIDAPSAVIISNLNATGIISTPVVDFATATIFYHIDADGLLVGSPVSPNTAMGQEHALVGEGIKTTPETGVPSLEVGATFGKVLVSGEWKDCIGCQIVISGEWKEIESVSVLNSGNWYLAAN